MPLRPPQAKNLEWRVTWYVLAGGLPAAALVLFWCWTTDHAPEVRWSIAAGVLIVWLGAAAAAHDLAVRLLHLIANLLGALREGDYSIRGLPAPSGSSVALVMREINDLGDTLQRQRTEAVESTALLSHVMEEIAVAVFAFDPDERLVFVNRAAARLLGRDRAALADASAGTLGLEEYLTGESRRLVDRQFGGPLGRYEVRRALFYREGRPHHLVVIADLSQALREEQQAAWQRIVRVLSHEINNSLTPIKSIAHSLRRIVDRAGEFSGRPEVSDGLALIEDRSGALGRFLRAYAQLARLPRPRPAPVEVRDLAGRVIELEKRLPVRLAPSPDLRVTADSDQLEQALINVVRNAVDASLETGGRVDVRWTRVGDWIDLEVEDEGRGLSDTSNLFVPFFTTKPNGSGIGLALSRQIAEAHGGTISLENRTPGPGCRATIRLPVGGPTGQR